MNATTGVLLRVIAFLSMLLVLMLFNHPVKAHDPDHPHEDAWYGALKQPDTIIDGSEGISCCGVGDAYFCDDMTSDKEGRTICTITDERPDDVRGNRPHIPVGTKIFIPTNKLIDAKQASTLGNPTGHGVIWVRGGAYDPGLFTVYCYMMGLLT